MEQQIEQAKAEVELIKPSGMVKPLLSLEPDVWKETLKAAQDAGTIAPDASIDLARILNTDIVTQASK